MDNISPFPPLTPPGPHGPGRHIQFIAPALTNGKKNKQTLHKIMFGKNTILVLLHDLIIFGILGWILTDLALLIQNVILMYRF